MKLSLGFSPCPNDTFIFEAMVHGRVDTEGLQFDYFLSDVEELNKRAFGGTSDITKISSGAFAYVAKDYLILDSGSALGFGNGPLLISKKMMDSHGITSSRIAIPGKYTTANLLFSLAWPDAVNKTEYLFSDIVDAILNDEADAGLIIHETRFTYGKKGLIMVADMGKYWEELTRLPVPLGLIVINRRVNEDIALKVNRIIRRSIEYAFRDPVMSFDFIRSNAREIKKSVLEKHIKLYVNNFSLDLGSEGKHSVTELFRIGREKGVLPEMPDKIFLTS